MKFFDNIYEASMRWYDGLTDRERRLMTILGSALCIMLVVVTVFLAITKISDRRSELQRNREVLSEIEKLEGQYLRARQQSEKARQDMARNNVSLFTFIQSVTSSLSLSVKDLSEQKRQLPKSDVVETSVKLNLSKLSIDRVTALIQAIETSDWGELIKVTRLKVNKRFDEPELLDLQMTISTWKSA